MKHPKKLALEVEEAFHRRVKSAATARGESLTDWLRSAILARLRKERKP